MKHAPSAKGGRPAKPQFHGPSQRQLRAGELVRHALAAILAEEDLTDPALEGVSVTLTEVRMSPDLRNATCFVEPLGAGVAEGLKAKEVVKGLNRVSKFLRGRLGREIELKFTPALKFLHDESFDEASRVNALFARPDVARDLRLADVVEDEGDLSPSPLRGRGEGDGGLPTTSAAAEPGLTQPSGTLPPSPSPLPREGGEG